MTFQPPPPPPPPPPAGPPGPPPGQWGPPPGQGPSGAGSFDPKSVNQLDWAILGAGFLLFILSFFNWYSYSEKGCTVVCGSADQSAWSGFFGWFGVLCAVLGSVAVGLSLFMPHVKLPIPNRLAGLGLWAIAALCVILAIFVIPDLSIGGVSVSSSATNTGHDFGFWLSLLVVLAGLVLSLMRAQQTNTALPGPLNKVPKIG